MPPNRKIIICKECKELKPNAGNTLCAKCYMKKYRKTPKGKEVNHKSYIKYSNTTKGKYYYKTYHENKGKYISRKHIALLKANALKIIGMKCCCCGLNNFYILTFDHIKSLSNIGEERPRFRDMCKEIISNPEGSTNKYQTMCFGCNISKGTGKKCKLNHSLITVCDILNYYNNLY